MLSFVILFIAGSYFLLISTFILGWRKIPFYTPKNEPSNRPTVSIIVACKNEEKTIIHLLDALTIQSHQDFELILVDDHSSDNTYGIFEKHKHQFKKLTLRKAEGQGKKNAIKEAILASESELIITTDADCIPSPGWIECILNFQAENNADLVICPIKIKEEESYFSKLQALEFVSLVASGAGAAGMNAPILCNAANMAFTKKAWLESHAELHTEEPSGDDIFLLQSIKKRGGKILFLKSKQAMVETFGAPTLKAFVKQRQRWAGKSPSYTDFMLIASACVVLAMSLLQVGLMAVCVLGYPFIYSTILVFALKYILDLTLLFSVKDFFELRKVGIYSLALSFIHPVYISYVALSALINKPKKW